MSHWGRYINNVDRPLMPVPPAKAVVDGVEMGWGIVAEVSILKERPPLHFLEAQDFT